MAELALASSFGNPLALAGLALLVPILLLYLLKPKPKLIEFPSIMFIRFIEKNKRFASFMQRFISDPILIVQLLVIALSVLAIAAPFYNSTQQLREEESIAIVIDSSASMQAKDAPPSRFDQAIYKAKDMIAGFNKNDEVSIIVAENLPAVSAVKATPEAASAALSELKAADTPSNVGDAIMLAKDVLSASERKKVVYVLSDFAPGGGLDPPLAKKVAAASGVDVQLLKIGEHGKNAGIVSLDARRSSAREGELYLTAAVSNIMGEQYNAKLQVFSGERLIGSQEKVIDAGAGGFFYLMPNISSEGQLVSAKLAGADDLGVDDQAFAWIPPVRMSRVLLLTSEGSDKFVRLMLQSLKNVQEPSVAVPPVTPDVSGFDIIVLGNVKGDTVLPGMFRDIKSRVHSGATLIVVATDGLQGITDPDLLSIMPVTLKGFGSREIALRVTQEDDMLTDVVFDNVMAKRYYNAAESDNSTKTIVGAEAYTNPMLAYRQYGDGYVVFMGLNSDPSWSNFYYSSSYPILWSQIIGQMTKGKSASAAVRLKTGEYLQLSEPAQITTPSGASTDGVSMFLDKAGVYKVSYPDRSDQVAVNLLDALETNITGADVGALEAAGYKVASQDVEVKVELYRHIMAVILACLIIELALYRRRGLL